MSSAPVSPVCSSSVDRCVRFATSPPTARSVAELPLSTGAVDDIPRVPDALTDPETEVGQVGEAFNAMLGHVEQSLTDRHESEQQLRQFLADASHELRTPLTTIQGYAELTRRADMATLESLQLAMGKVQTESTRMAALVEDMLLLARLDCRSAARDRPRSTSSHLVLEAVNDARVVDPDRRYQRGAARNPARRSWRRAPAPSGGEQPAEQRPTAYASWHHGPGRRADPRDRRRDPRCTTTGPGCLKLLQGKEFERFSRGDSSRTRLGAIRPVTGVRDSVCPSSRPSCRRTTGDVSVTSKPGDTTFVLRFPATL